MIDSIVLNCAYIILFLSLAVRDMLVLRVIMTVACVCFITFGILSSNTSMISWNILFIVLNIYQVIRLVLERRPVSLSKEMEAIYESRFKNMKRRDFLNFWHFGNEMCYLNALVCEEGEDPDQLMFLVNGKADVKQGEKLLASLQSNNFVAEMSYMSDKPASADVTITGTTIVWTRKKLEKIESIYPSLIHDLRISIGGDLSQKLRRSQ